MTKNLNNDHIPQITTSFNKIECMDYNTFVLVFKYINSGTFWSSGDVGLFVQTPGEYIVAAKAYPFRIAKYFGIAQVTENTSAAVTQFKISNLSGVENTQVYIPSSSNHPFYKIATMSVPTKYNSFLDYAPFTKIELFLPYAGFVTLDPQVLMGESFDIDITIDFNSGRCKYWIVRVSDSSVVMTSDGVIGIDIPIGASNNNDNSKKFMNSIGLAAGGAISSLVTGNPLGAVAGVTAGAKTAIDAAQIHISKGTVGGDSTAVNGPYDPYMIITRPTLEDTEYSYAYVKGRPLFKPYAYVIAQGRSYIGFTVFDNPRCQGSAGIATDSELAELESLLSSGVYI